MSKIDTLTAGEMAIAERKSGMAITALENPNAPKIALLTALAWVVLKREDSKAKYEDAEALTLTQIMDVLGLSDEEEENPTKKS